MAIIAALALGVCVTGTLLWMQNRPAPPILVLTSAMAPSTSLPDGLNPLNMPNAPDHPPPAELTMGLTPPQAALVLGKVISLKRR